MESVHKFCLALELKNGHSGVACRLPTPTHLLRCFFQLFLTWIASKKLLWHTAHSLPHVSICTATPVQKLKTSSRDYRAFCGVRKAPYSQLSDSTGWEMPIQKDLPITCRALGRSLPPGVCLQSLGQWARAPLFALQS